MYMARGGIERMAFAAAPVPMMMEDRVAFDEAGAPPRPIPVQKNA